MSDSAKEALEILYEVRESMHGDVDVSVRMGVDRAIALLQEEDRTGKDDQVSRRYVMDVLAGALRLLPSLINFFSRE